MDKVYRCANCGGLYEVKVSQCDCMPSQQTFTEHAVMPWDEAARLIAEVERLTVERDALAEGIGKAVVSAGIAQNVPMTGPELLLMLDSLASAVQP